MAAPLVLAEAAKQTAKKVAKWTAKKVGNATADRIDNFSKKLRLWLLAGIVFGSPLFLMSFILVAVLGVATTSNEPSEEAASEIGQSMLDLFTDGSANTDNIVPWELLAATSLTLTNNGQTNPYTQQRQNYTADRVLPILQPGIEPPANQAQWQGGGEGILLWNPQHPDSPANPQNTSDSIQSWAWLLQTAATKYTEALGFNLATLQEAGVLNEGEQIWIAILDELIEVRFACDTDNPPSTTTTIPTTTASLRDFVAALVWYKPCPPAMEIDPDGPPIYGTPTEAPSSEETPEQDQPQSATGTQGQQEQTTDEESVEVEEVCLSGCAAPRLVAPPPPQPAGREIVAKAQWAIGEGTGPGGPFIPGAFISLNPTVAAAYRQAAAAAFASYRACNIDVYFIAGIGRTESEHGTHGGATVAPDGTVAPPIRNSESTAKGPMQILDGTWADIAADGNGDGLQDRDNIFDATTAAATYLCRYLPEGLDARTDQGQRAMLKWYNSTPGYYETVNGFAGELLSQDRQAASTFSFGGDIGAPVEVGTNLGALTRDCGPSPQRLAQKPGGIIMPCHLRSIVFNLYAVPNANGGTTKVSQMAAPYAAAMFQAALQAGIPLGGGGYRTAAGQIAVRKSNCGTSNYAIYLQPSGSCRPPTARPGSSMHETGEALDLTCAGVLIGNRSTNRCYLWLEVNARYFGYYNLSSEPWHFSSNAH